MSATGQERESHQQRLTSGRRQRQVVAFILVCVQGPVRNTDRVLIRHKKRGTNTLLLHLRQCSGILLEYLFLLFLLCTLGEVSPGEQRRKTHSLSPAFLFSVQR